MEVGTVVAVVDGSIGRDIVVVIVVLGIAGEVAILVEQEEVVLVESSAGVAVVPASSG